MIIIAGVAASILLMALVINKHLEGWLVLAFRPRLWPFVKRAMAKREKATWPGCRQGYDDCLDTSCWCTGNRPSSMFILRACEKMRDEA